MSVRRTGSRLGLTLAVCGLLAACATQPSRPPPTPAVVTPLPEVPAPTIAPSVPPQPTDQPWAGIVASDVMPDCADAPLIRANAAMYTRSPARFEQLLKQSLPLIIYVHAQLQAAGIPGEFTMLPMLESSYNPAQRGRRHGPAGMWQFIPGTARLHGAAASEYYDGRLDPVASTRAAVRMLKILYAQFGDWRLVAMAYNAGPYAIMGALRDHPEGTGKPIPDLSVSNTTRTHLARMMALSCILREPERFEVQLPQPSAADELATIEVPAGTRLGDAAGMAEVSEARLRTLNPGYTGASVPPDSPRTLLLPAASVQALAAALAVDTSESVAQVNAPAPGTRSGDAIPLPAEPRPPRGEDPPAAATHTVAARHRVREGETLWSIAHRYHVDVKDLKRWNGLHGDTLRAGEELRVRG